MLGLAGLSVVTLSGVTDDMRRTLGRGGCDAIPYADLRADCREGEQEARAWCGGAKGPTSCGPFTQRGIDRAMRREAEALRVARARQAALSERADAGGDRILDVALAEAVGEASRARAALTDLRRQRRSRDDRARGVVRTLGGCLDGHDRILSAFARAESRRRSDLWTGSARSAPPSLGLARAVRGHRLAVGEAEAALRACRRR